MLPFDEPKLVRRLKGISPDGQRLFALACATRLADVYERGGSDLAPAVRILDELWKMSGEEAWPPHRVEAALEPLMDLMRAVNENEEEREEENNDEAGTAAYLDHALAALAYALRAYTGETAQDAAWAARRVYEALDHWVIAMTRQPTNKAEELELLGHPVIQQELQRQARDLAELERVAGPSRELIETARRRALIEGQELVMLLRSVGAA